MNAHVDEFAAHAVYAPSSAHRWTVCTASAEAIAALGEQEEGAEAKEGTEAHEEIERILGQFNGFYWRVGSGGSWLNQVNSNHPAALGVALLLDYVRQLPPGKVWIEQRVRLTGQIWGRCDVAHWHEESATLTIVDYKNGFVDVDAVENPQLRIYGAGSIYTHKLPAKWIRYVVVQPNSFMPVPRVKQCIEDADSLHSWASKTAAIPTGEKKFVAGEECKYCPLFGRCPASQDVLLKLNVVLASTPDQVSPTQRAIFAACKKPIEDWFKSADKIWTKDALTKGVPPGMKLVTTIKHREWKPEIESALRDSIVTLHGIDALPLPTPAQVEKLGKINVDELSTKAAGAPALAFASDKRAEWKQKSVAEMFAGVVNS